MEDKSRLKNSEGGNRIDQNLFFMKTSKKRLFF
jgi:hypothetical protein